MRNLTDILRYDQMTGELFWLESRGTKKAGSLAGNARPDGYIGITINKQKYLAHRICWLLYNKSLPKKGIDHINGVKTDNRIENLRDVSQLQNNRNAKKRKDNTSGFTGVSWQANVSRWIVKITHNKKRINVGSYTHLSDAVKARLDAERDFSYHINHGREA